MNIRLIAALLLADAELQKVERVLKRRNEWRTARKIGSIRSTLAYALVDEQQSLSALVAKFQEPMVTDRSARQ